MGPLFGHLFSWLKTILVEDRWLRNLETWALVLSLDPLETHVFSIKEKDPEKLSQRFSPSSTSYKGERVSDVRRNTILWGVSLNHCKLNFTDFW